MGLDLLLVAAYSAAPIVERTAIPLAVALGYDPVLAFAVATIGNLLPIVPLLLVLEYLTERLRKIGFLDRIFERVFAHTREREGFIRRFEWWGLVFLALLGVYTAAAAAYLFGFRKKSAFVAISVGAIAASCLITLGTLGVVNIVL